MPTACTSNRLPRVSPFSLAAVPGTPTWHAGDRRWTSNLSSDWEEQGTQPARHNTTASKELNQPVTMQLQAGKSKELNQPVTMQLPAGKSKELNQPITTQLQAGKSKELNQPITVLLSTGHNQVSLLPLVRY
ncbi:UNVERIFIED_CONTAM: hypothetical protein FKN15_071288 [Acipenser sinensis]